MQTVGGVMTPQTLTSLQGMVNALFGTPGNVWWVDPQFGNDNNPGNTPAAAFQSLTQAHSSASDANNDVVYLIAKSNSASLTTSYQSVGLTWSKSLLHLIGVNGAPFLGQRSRVGALATAATFPNLFTLSGNGCLIQNIEFFQGSTATNPTAASTCVTVSGQRNHFLNCQISGIGHSDLDDAGSNSLTITGSENYFQHCYIGLSTIIRATATAEVVITGAVARTFFEDCEIESWTSGSTFKAVTVPTAAQDWVTFKNCIFSAVENITSAVAPTGAIGITTLAGLVKVINPAIFGYALLSTGGNAYVKVVTFQAATSVQGIGASAAAS